MLTSFSTDPNYWDTLATNELLKNTKNTEKFKITYELIYRFLKYICLCCYSCEHFFFLENALIDIMLHYQLLIQMRCGISI